MQMFQAHRHTHDELFVIDEELGEVTVPKINSSLVILLFAGDIRTSNLIVD